MRPCAWPRPRPSTAARSWWRAPSKKGRGDWSATPLRKIARLCADTGQLAEAEAALDAAIAEEGAILGAEYWEVTEMRDERAVLYRRRGQEARALAEENEVLRLLAADLVALDGSNMDAASIARLKAKREVRVEAIEARRRN